MKELYLKPFVLATRDISIKDFGVEVNIVNFKREKTLEMNHEVIFALGIKGDLKGLALFGMSKDHAINIASQGLAHQGYPNHYKWDELSQSFLKEYGNHVGGSATKLYERINFDCNITEPNYKPAESTRFHVECYSFEVVTREGKINIKLYLKENN